MPSIYDSSNLSAIPIGTCLPLPASGIPYGYLLCDGAAVSRSVYAVLYTNIGNAHGSGDNSTTFNIPDYRGRFLRGRDGGVARDLDRVSRSVMATGGNVGDNIGSVQAESFNAHSHVSHGYVSQTFFSYSGGGGTAGITTPLAADSSTVIASTGGNETRPLNATVNYIIRYK